MVLTHWLYANHSGGGVINSSKSTWRWWHYYSRDRWFLNLDQIWWVYVVVDVNLAPLCMRPQCVSVVTGHFLLTVIVWDSSQSGIDNVWMTVEWQASLQWITLMISSFRRKGWVSMGRYRTCGKEKYPPNKVPLRIGLAMPASTCLSSLVLLSIQCLINTAA